MKKRFLMLLVSVLAAAMLFAAGTGESADNVVRIYTNRTESHVAYQLWKNLVERYQTEVDPDFKVEFETVANLDQYKDKLKLYIAGDDLPDIFQIDTGPIAQELADMDKLVDIEAELKRLGMYDDLDVGCREYVAFDNGDLYIFPESRYGNTIFYWKDKFEAAGITEMPDNYTEFLEACEKLKQNGEIPLAITGKASWNPLHVMYLPSFAATGSKWIDTAKKGETTFAGEPVVWDSVNWLQALVDNDYLPPGFQNMEYTDIMNGFLGGQYAMAWAQSLYIPQMEKAYDEGRLGFMLIPENENYDGPRLATLAIQTGISWAFNKDKFDERMQDFFDFVMEHYTEESYKLGLFSPFNSEVPETASRMMKDFYAEMVKQTICWINWDDHCDPVTCQAMDDMVKEFVSGMMTGEEFITLLDESVQEYGVPYFNE